MVNCIHLMGRLTAAPEMRTTSSGTSFVRFSLAVERDYADESGERQTDFVNCAAWRGTAEFINKWFRKGQMIYVQGSLRQVRWTTDDGENRSSYEVNVDKASFCSSKSESDAEGRQDDTAAPKPQDKPEKAITSKPQTRRKETKTEPQPTTTRRRLYEPVETPFDDDSDLPF